MSVNWCETCRKYTNNVRSPNGGPVSSSLIPNHVSIYSQFVGGFYVIRGENSDALEGSGGGSSSNGSRANGNGTSNGRSNGQSNGSSNGASNGSSRRQ
ncbi:hypothetical protein OOU_Y34scaffold00448g5 [Pyricularia oryzae Y34]|uniref:Uncharacterized protein n=2 Tax=Pyricularia oryzae TaxID=318829 RepID=A0AA97PMM1_PYRO3|nr:hypothetical protein OOU_Y34scaffold00448g5 [Pyricularia oryzae Y34]